MYCNRGLVIFNINYIAVGHVLTFSFQFDDATLFPEHTSSPVEIDIQEAGHCHGLVVWWDIDLGGVTLTRIYAVLWCLVVSYHSRH